MFIKKNDFAAVDEAIDRLLVEMKDHSGTTSEYGVLADRLTQLYKIKENNSPKSVDPNTLLTVGANLGGILAIISHEKLHVVTSKALGFVMKLR